MLRWKLLCGAVAVGIVATAVTLLVPGSSSAASDVRYTPGFLQVEGDHGIFISRYNPTSKSIETSAQLVHATSGWDDTSRGTVTIPPGATGNVLFSCAETSSFCSGIPIVRATGKGLIVSATYVADGSASRTAVPAGSWVIFK